MTPHNPTAGIFIPDEKPLTEALARITHLGIGAHQDDLEFMAFHGILECFATEEKWFGGVTCTNGAGSSRNGAYAKFSDAEMMAIRRKEQDAAASIGKYGAMIQLDYPSAAVKNPNDLRLTGDLFAILTACLPEIIYTHNPADKHDTHIGVTIAAIHAMREMPAAQRPRKVIGCEVWRALDWLPDDNKVLMDVSGHDDLAAALNSVFGSQIAGGKRYDLAILGRRSANATFLDSHSSDDSNQIIYGIDLTPLIVDTTADIVDFTCSLISAFEADVRAKLTKQLGN